VAQYPLVHKLELCITTTTDNTYLLSPIKYNGCNVWYLAPNQVLIHQRDSKTNKRDDGDNNCVKRIHTLISLLIKYNV
jgi:hypothetical protein